MIKNTPAAARFCQRRSVHRKRLVAALLVVCRKVRRLQAAPEARAAYDDVARWLRTRSTVPAHRWTGKKG
jgi:hypothetical protein